MAENRLGIGRIAFPQSIDVDTLLALEEFNRKVDDNLNFLLHPTVLTPTGNISIVETDSVVFPTTAVTLTLPQASTVPGKKLTIKNGSNSSVIIDGYETETIDGDTTCVLSQIYQSIMLVSTGSQWLIEARL